MIAGFIVVNPFEFSLSKNEVVKHLPILITLLVFGFSVTANQLHQQERRPEIVRIIWPILLLAVFIVGGSLYVRFFEGNRYTFMTVGLYMSLLYISTYFFTRTAAPDSLLRIYFFFLLTLAGVMSLYLIRYFNIKQVYHEQIFLVIPFAVFFALGKIPSYLKWLGFFFFMAMSIASKKNTSYLIGIMVFLYLAVMVWMPSLRSQDGLHRSFKHYLFFLLFAILGAAVAYFVSYRETYLPSGNPEYRLHTYQQVWQDFQTSPIWGSLFTNPAVRKFTVFDVGIADNLLPTHSDLLDLAGQGGVFALFLWAAGLYLVFRLAYRSILAPKFLSDPWAPYAHTLAVMSIAAVITYIFNPILLQPGMAYLVWTNLGFLLGMSLLKQKTENDG
jgi:hypothetical protein